MASESTLTAERLRERLDYDPATGVFRWRALRRATRIGAEAGFSDDDGYRRVAIDGKSYLAHRLAWLYVHGVWPAGELDHRNETPSDNRIANLREATHGQNQHNIGGPKTNNGSGFRGVSYSGGAGRWYARISTDGVARYLGLFDTPEEAHAAYLAAKAELHPFWTSSEVSDT